jgi:DNA-binding LacI/PurR family transcriptional regulator
LTVPPSTKTESVREQVFDAILHGEYLPGDAIPAEREMAEITGTSRITVRRAYAQLEKSGILERRQGRGTTIRTVPQGNREEIEQIALLFSLRTPFALEAVEVFEREIARRDAVMVLKLTGDDPKRESQAAIDLVARGIRNLIVWPSGTGFSEQVFSRLRILGANTVFFDRAMPGDYADFVGLDEAHAIRTLMGDIKRRGTTELSLVSFEGAKTLPLSRREEYIAVECEKAGIVHKLHRVPFVGRIDGKLRANRRKWFPNGKGKGVFCINDEIAVVVREICGAQLPIWGIDGLPIAAEAGITSYRQPIAKMARKAIELLARQQRLGHRWRAQRVLLQGKLVKE